MYNSFSYTAKLAVASESYGTAYAPYLYGYSYGLIGELSGPRTAVGASSSTYHSVERCVSSVLTHIVTITHPNERVREIQESTPQTAPCALCVGVPSTRLAHKVVQ